MIKFLRTFRKKLLSENKYSRYLLYAIGEIILVVIGILIALQINTWNEERKLSASEKEILQNLRVELISNRDRLEESNKRHTKEFEDGVQLLKLFGTDVKNSTESKLDSLLGNIEAGYTFEANDGYIKSLIASNKIDHIKNAELKSYISYFESMVVDATQEDTYIKQLLNERLWPAIDGKISTLNRLTIYEQYPEFPRGTYPSDYAWFLNNREMEDVVANITSWKKEIIKDEQILLNAINRMIELSELQ